MKKNGEWKNGGETSIVNAAPYVMEVLEMTGFAEMFNIK